MVMKHFGHLQNPSQSRKPEVAVVYPYKQAEALVVTDRKLLNVSINYPFREASRAIAEYRDDIETDVHFA
jgi:hypothetical protein